MIRTQIYLDKELHKDLTVLARKQQESMAKVARDILKEGLKRRKSIDTSGKEALKKIIAMKVTGGPKDLSSNLDYYLYGDGQK